MPQRSGEGPGGTSWPIANDYAPASGDSAGAGHPWQVRRLSGTASDLHHRSFAAPAERTVWFLEVVRPALVLGSTQVHVDAPIDTVRGHTIDIVRRRSGGGAVLVRPGHQVWADVLVPAGDPLWDPDVGRAFHWLGAAWVRALAALGIGDVSSHAGALRRSPWSDRVCFAGLGPGEVSVGGRKVVGISQRRTRDWSLFQCAALLDWDADAAETAALLDVPLEAISGAAAALPVTAETLESAFVTALAG